jgi:hypothetical protein
MSPSSRATLDDLISRHMAAYKAFTVVCEQIDLADNGDTDLHDPGQARRDYDRLDRAETAAALAILTYRPQSLSECAARARYILHSRTILEALYTENDFVDVYLKSFLLPDA